MANNYNANPIILTATMASGWRALQTLNTGNQPVTLQQVSGAVTRQLGITVSQVVWTGMTAQAHTFSIIDPNDSTILLQGTAGSALTDQFYAFNDAAIPWRDFKVSQLSSGTIMIWYRF